MPQINISVDLPSNYTLKALAEKMGPATVDKHQLVSNLVNLLQSLSAGGTIGKVTASTSPTVNTDLPSTTVTIVYGSVVEDTSGFNIGAIEFNCVSVLDQPQSFRRGASAAETVANIVTAINTTSATMFGGLFFATAGTSAVTITLTQPGLSLYDLGSVDAGFSLSQWTTSAAGFDSSITQYYTVANFGL